MYNIIFLLLYTLQLEKWRKELPYDLVVVLLDVYPKNTKHVQSMTVSPTAPGLLFWWGLVFSSWMMVIAFQWGSLFLLVLLCKRKVLKWKSEYITSLLKRPWWLPTLLRAKAKSPPCLDHSFCSDFTFDHSPPCSFSSSVTLLLLNLSQHITPGPPEPVPSHPLSGHPSPTICTAHPLSSAALEGVVIGTWTLAADTSGGSLAGEERGPRGSRKRQDGGKLLTIKWPQAWFFWLK